MKGFLTAPGIQFPHTHDVSRLIVQCQAITAEFADFVDASEALTPYAVRLRYPGGPLEPSVSDARRALQLATEIVQFVRSRLPLGG